MSNESTYSSPGMQTVKRGVKAALADSRKAFDKSPSAMNWEQMLIWSLVWQQLRSWRGMNTALELCFQNSVTPSTNEFAVTLLKALYPDQSIRELIRS